MADAQRVLTNDKIEAFYHDNFVKSQVNDFISLLGKNTDIASGKVVDIGGGCGYFAGALEKKTGSKVRVIDTDLKSIEVCKQANIDAIYGDALAPVPVGDERVICFNLILHHLVGSTDSDSYKLQTRALANWHQKDLLIFVNEYIYESFFLNNISGWLIYQITSSTILSKIGYFVSKFMPSLQANTFGVGVRFRSHSEWVKLFNSLGFDVIATSLGKQEGISLPRRMLLIKNCRRDSFVLRPRVS